MVRLLPCTPSLRGLLLGLWLSLVMKADSKCISLALALDSSLDISTKTHFLNQTHSLSPLAKPFLWCHIFAPVSRFSSHPDAESLIAFPLIRHSFAVSPASILSFPFPLIPRRLHPPGDQLHWIWKATQRLAYARSVFSLSLVQFSLHISIFFKVNLPCLWD